MVASKHLNEVINVVVRNVEVFLFQVYEFTTTSDIRTGKRSVVAKTTSTDSPMILKSSWRIANEAIFVAQAGQKKSETGRDLEQGRLVLFNDRLNSRQRRDCTR
jgi:hypothetical protein